MKYRVLELDLSLIIHCGIDLEVFQDWSEWMTQIGAFS